MRDAHLTPASADADARSASDRGAGLRVLALGACTPVGGNARATAAAVRAGLCGFVEHDYLVDDAGEPMRVARVASIDAELQGAERLVALLAPVLDEVLTDGHAAPRGRIGVAVALPPPRPGGPGEAHEQKLDAGPAAQAVRALCRARLGERLGPYQAFPTGHAGGFQALDQARTWLRAGQAEAVIVAGVDSYLAPLTLEWLEAEGQLHGAGLTNNAYGFVPGEAAGALLLAGAAAGSGTDVGSAPAWAELLAVGLGRETRLNKSDGVCVGEGLTQALRHALDEVATQGMIDNVVCDMNGEAYRADEYGFSGLRVRDRLRDPTDFLAPADCWGDVGAAGAPLHLLLAASAGRKGHAKGPLSLLWGSSDGGERGAAIIRAAVAQRT